MSKNLKQTWLKCHICRPFQPSDNKQTCCTENHNVLVIPCVSQHSNVIFQNYGLLFVLPSETQKNHVVNRPQYSRQKKTALSFFELRSHIIECPRERENDREAASWYKWQLNLFTGTISSPARPLFFLSFVFFGMPWFFWQRPGVLRGGSWVDSLWEQWIDPLGRDGLQGW